MARAKPDTELQSIRRITQILLTMPVPQRRRVLQYVTDRVEGDAMARVSSRTFDGGPGEGERREGVRPVRFAGPSHPVAQSRHDASVPTGEGRW